MSLSACSKSFVGLPFPSQRAMGGGGQGHRDGDRGGRKRQGPINIGSSLMAFSTLWSTAHLFLVLLFENYDDIGLPDIILPRATQILSAALKWGMYRRLKARPYLCSEQT